MQEKRRRLEQQLQFIVEIDKVKYIMRQNYVADGSRRENDAEHSWHIALMAILLKEYVGDRIDLEKVVTMVLIHDLVEIDAGDTYAYDDSGMAESKVEREVQAANRIFGLLPEEQGRTMRALWDEFEAYETEEAKYAHLLDNFQPMLLNHASDGKSWREHGVKKEQIYKRNERITEVSGQIWERMQELIEENVMKGNVKEK